MSTTQNSKQMRHALHMANPPCIPYLGVAEKEYKDAVSIAHTRAFAGMYLTDLTFIEEGNDDFDGKWVWKVLHGIEITLPPPGDGLINFVKRRHYAATLQVLSTRRWPWVVSGC